MFNLPAITWTLTIVLLLSGSYHVLQAVKSRHLTDQINKSLHALMHVLMAAMLWNLAPSTMLAQIAILTGAALWFIIQAVSRPEFKILCATSQGRLKCVYHSLTMTGAALMITMMGHVTATGPGTVQAGGSSMTGMPMANEHHMMATPTQIATAATVHHSPNPAIPLTVFFATAAVILTIGFVQNQVTKTSHQTKRTPPRSARTEHAIEALGATIMALMFATMSA